MKHNKALNEQMKRERSAVSSAARVVSLRGDEIKGQMSALMSLALSFGINKDIQSFKLDRKYVQKILDEVSKFLN